MCGIAGVLVFQGSAYEITPGYLTSIIQTMAHRGPDNCGMWIDEHKKTGFGHRRLSIIDLSPQSNQPMNDTSDRYYITFNGEIYNHGQIRRELIELGVTEWKTDHSDTEVILNAFKAWGIDCVHKFNGMFAFGIWDKFEKRLWLARDRIGIKPLYYSMHSGRLVFASEIKALLCDPGQKRELNEDAFFHYLSFLVAPSPETCFQGIQKMPPATWMCFSPEGLLRQETYWDAYDNRTALDGHDETDIARRLYDTLHASIKLRKVSDVPVGVFLSGGLDSSINATLFSDNDQEAIDTFTIGYEGDNATYKNETEYARLVAERIHARQHERYLNSEDMISFLPTLIHLQDEPIGDPVCFPLYYVSQLARQNGVTVCQLGEGADELFCGYPFWKKVLTLQKTIGKHPFDKFSIAIQHLLSITGQSHSLPYEAFRRAAQGVPLFWGGAEAFTHRDKLDLLGNDIRRKYAHTTSWDAIEPIYRRYRDRTDGGNSLQWMTYLDLSYRLPELLLMRVDKMTMGNSIEARVPFLDHNVVSLAMSIPDALKIKNGSLKHILKKAFNGTIPDEIIHRKKQGFNVPIYEWLFERLGVIMEKELISFSKRTGYFDVKAVRNHIARPKRKLLWYMFNFALWWKYYIAEEKVLT